MNHQNEAVVFSKPVLETFTVANEYCIFMSEAESRSREYLSGYLQKISPLLYLKGSLLPQIHPSYPEASVRFVTEEEWQNIFNTLRQKFNPDDEFWFIDQETHDYENPVKGSLAEHYTDIYHEMKDFVLLYSRDSLTDKENAVSNLRRAFPSGWGLCLATAHAVLHGLLYFPKTKI
ncbi:MAG: DUF5063 domain-containing protein [Bacteroidales bacterium]|nr:DUF5063 domain-containing protein [Bacteroidales bacterium]